MNAHTPGLWLQAWNCDAPTGSDASPKYDGFEVVTNSGWPIAFLPIHFVFPPVRSEMNKRELDWDEASANLRLISAAPELLEALQKFLEYEKAMNERDDVSGMFIYAEFSELARTSIAKATGEKL